MAASVSTPWVLSTALEMQQPGPRITRCKPYVVQVVRVLENLRILEVSDSQHSIAVVLTESCVRELDVSLTTLRNSLVKLERWHLSTMYCAAADKSIEDIRAARVSTPLVIHCAGLRPFGCDDLVEVGNPRDVNEDEELRRRCFDGARVVDVSARLAARQFGEGSVLPGPELRPVSSRNRVLGPRAAELRPEEQLVLAAADHEKPGTLTHRGLLEWRTARVEQEAPLRRSTRLNKEETQLDESSAKRPRRSPEALTQVETQMAFPASQLGALNMVDDDDEEAPMPLTQDFLSQLELDSPAPVLISPSAASRPAPADTFPATQTEDDGAPITPPEPEPVPAEKQVMEVVQEPAPVQLVEAVVVANTPRSAVRARSKYPLVDAWIALWRGRSSERTDPPSEVHRRLAPDLYRPKEQATR